MILDPLDHAALGFARAFEFLRTFDRARPDGRCEIEGEAVYATLMSLETKAPSNLSHEVHRTYARASATSPTSPAARRRPCGRRS